MRIELVIDELVLIGFDARDRHRVQDALRAELATMLAAEAGRRAWLRAAAGNATGDAIARRGADVRVGHAASAASIARGIAGSVLGAVASSGDATINPRPR